MYFWFSRIYRYKSYLFLLYIIFCAFCATVWFSRQVNRNSEYLYEDEVVHVTWRTDEVVEPCHESRENDVLELVTNQTKIASNSIFFHHTTCIMDLSSRQACSVESAAKANPGRQINILFTSSITAETLKNGSLSRILDEYKNVKLRRVLLSDYVRGTPLESTVATIRKDILYVQMSKIMKYLTLYKYSGTYLSFDMIVARSLNLWPNWAVKDSPVSLSADMFAFSNNTIGRKLAKNALGYLKSELSINKVRDFWSYSGPSVLTHLLSTWCTTDRVEQMRLNVCKDIAVHDPELFYPITFHQRKQYFKIVDWKAWKRKVIYTYFIWDHFTKYNLVPPLSLYGRIAKEYCPLTYERYTEGKGLWYYMQK